MKGCRPLTDSEIATVKDTFVRTRDKALFILGLKTGLRISELLSLKVGDVYQYGRLGDVVYVERKHMKKKLEGRAIPLHQDAKVALSVWIKELEKAGEADSSSPLFKSRKGQCAIIRVQAFRVLKEVYEANGLMGKLGTHSMRKTFADRIYDRHGLRSTLITSQLPLESWHDFIADGTLADAILDRLVHNAYKIKMKGESMRKWYAKKDDPDMMGE